MMNEGKATTAYAAGAHGSDSQQQQTVQHPSVGAVPQHAEIRVQIKNVDMPVEMQERAIELARGAVGQAAAQAAAGQPAMGSRDIAGAVKKEFDRLYGPSWHCIVGKAFGSFVTHEANCFIFFYLDNWAIMLFKTA